MYENLLEKEQEMQRNPYEVLGLKEGASAEEIKAAYRELVKKYHPDRHQDNPLEELAEEKMREINEAYETLINGGGKTAYSSQNSGSYSGSSAGEFVEIRKSIDRGDLRDAEARLTRIGERNAEWYYLFGVMNIRRGWFNEGVSNIQAAVNMDPSNYEYRNTLNSVVSQAGGYKQGMQQRGYNSPENMMCQALQCYCCADMCCDCI